MGTSYCPRRSKVFSDDEADVSGTVFSSGGAGLMVCGSRRRLKTVYPHSEDRWAAGP